MYVEGNPVTRTDPSGNWACTGHLDCEKWVENTLDILSQTSATGRAIVDYFNQQDKIWMSAQKPLTSSSFVNYCKELPLTNGVLVKFGEPWPGPSYGTAFYKETLQLRNSPDIINGTNPDGFGLQLFAHEVSHWAQGITRFTIQGELLSRFVEMQIRNDLRTQYGTIKEEEPTKLLTNEYSPYNFEDLKLAQRWMSEKFAPSYGYFPLSILGGLSQSYLDRFNVTLPIPDKQRGPKQIPPPTPPLRMITPSPD